MDAPLIPLGLLLIGGYLSWFGVHYFRSDTKWPTDPIKSILQGKGLPAATQTPTPAEAATLSGAVGEGAPSGPAASGSAGSAAAASRSPAAATSASNQQIGKLLAASYGWSTGAEWTALVTLWNDESGWSNTADTRKSGLDPSNATVFAYGIPQARPYSKMPKAGWPPDKGGNADPTTQIRWGLAYIKGTYGTPTAALAHENSRGWY